MSERMSHLAYLMTQRPRLDRAVRANRKLIQAVRKGTVAKPSACSRCGNIPAPRDLHGHHTDYDKPLDVVWLCRPCHSAEHIVLRSESERARKARLRDPNNRLNKLPRGAPG